MGEHVGSGPVDQPDEPQGPAATPAMTTAPSPAEEAKAFTEVGWVVFGVSSILGFFLGRDHGASQVVRILAMPVLLLALVQAARARRWGWAAAAAFGLTAAVGIQVSAT